MTFHIFCVHVSYVLPMEYLYFLPKISQLKKKAIRVFVFLPKTIRHNYLCLTTSSFGRF